jgi:hypothetical protein
MIGTIRKDHGGHKDRRLHNSGQRKPRYVHSQIRERNLASDLRYRGLAFDSAQVEAFVKKPSDFLAFVIFPYCELRVLKGYDGAKGPWYRNPKERTTDNEPKLLPGN